MICIKAFDPMTQTYDNLDACETLEQCDKIAETLCNVMYHNHLHVAGTNRSYIFLAALDFEKDKIIRKYSAYWARLLYTCCDQDESDMKARVLDANILRETEKLNKIPEIPEDQLYWHNVSSIGI